jgi:DNA topoisomerase-2
VEFYDRVVYIPVNDFLQDHDGSHIKGLLINFLDHFYPSLLKLPDFLVEFVTPIVRVR